MAVTSAYLRHESTAAHTWIGVMMAMLGLAVGCGYTLAMGEIVGLYVAASLVLAVAVLFDFRIGAVLLILMLPFSASSLFPHGMMGITGLNPLNLLLMATIGSYVIAGRMLRQGPALLPRQVALLYIPPIVVAGLIGMPHVQDIPVFFYEYGLSIATERQYLITLVVKPMVILTAVLMIGAAAARSDKPERFIVAIAVSIWVIVLIQLGFVLSQGVPLAAMATPGARSFYAPIGIHANELGRLHLYAAALLLFVWAESKRPGMRLFLLITLGAVALGLLLSFSRASIAGAVLVGALFLMWKFNARSLALAIIGLMLMVLVAGDLLYARLTLGMGESADAVSAGRIEGIWLPLLPELAKSPIWGNGLSSVMWSFPMLNGSMAPVGHAHNAYLQAALDMGFLGLALTLAYFAHVWKGFKALSREAWLNSELRGFFQGAMAGLAAFLFTCLVGSTLMPDAATAPLWIAIGLMYGLRARKAAA
jgi:O-antigen ligase